MNDLRKEKTPAELYREYQNSRDDIPPATLHTLISATEQARHDDNIHLLLQKAKLVEAGRDNYTAQEQQSRSLGDRLKAMLGPRLSNGWGMALASLALAVIALPVMIDRGGSPFSEVSHLQDCTECATYITDAAVVTRSTVPGLNPLSADARIASKLGRIRANLMIASITDNAAITDTSVRELSKFGSSLADSEINKLMSSSTPSASDLAMALTKAPQVATNAPFFDAAQNLQLSLITAAASQPGKGVHDIQTTLEKAVEAYARIPERSELQDTVLEQLEDQRQRIQPGDTKALQELLTRALQSLGA